MLMSTLSGRSVEFTDGEIGNVSDLYFDDERWVVRYLVVETGKWLSHKPILVSPISVLSVENKEIPISVNLKQELLSTAPNIDLKKPVSRRFEIEYSKHFSYPVYWGGVGIWGSVMFPTVFNKTILTEDEEKELLENGGDEAHLRSSSEVCGYKVIASNGSVGSIKDFLIDSRTWEIFRIVVDTKNWFPGKKVLIKPSQISEFVWSESVARSEQLKEELNEMPVIN
jgi:uncharacterized protein YrrD